jgi:hypothetical protein
MGEKKGWVTLGWYKGFVCRIFLLFSCGSLLCVRLLQQMHPKHVVYIRNEENSEQQSKRHVHGEDILKKSQCYDQSLLVRTKQQILLEIWKIIALLIMSFHYHNDRLSGLVVRVPGYRSGGLGSIPGTTRKKLVVL